MERHLIFMGWKTNCYDGNATQSNLQIQCNLYQNPRGLFCRNVKAYLKINMELKRISNSQNNLEKEK